MMLARRCKPLLGTFVEIECDCPDAIDAGFAAIQRIHRLMSAHDPESELSRINRYACERPIEINDDTRAVLERSLYWSRLSNGAFDPVRAGGKAVQERRLPRHAGQPTPDPLANWRALRIDGARVSLALPACIDLGGIAKGYAVDLAVTALEHAGASAGLVNAGGDFRAFGARSFSVAIVEPLERTPFARVEISNAGLATSAGLAVEEALSFDHLLDETQGWTSVTVQARTACDADALAKIVWALGENAIDLLGAHGADAFAIADDGGVHFIGQRALAA